MWLLYSVAVASLLALGGHAVNQVLRLQSRPTRWVWVCCLLGSALIPAVMPMLPVAVPAPSLGPIGQPYTIELGPVSALEQPPLLSLADVFVGLWVCWSLALLCYGLAGVRQMRRAHARWRWAQLGGERVLVSRDVGPAVVGVLDPAIVVPEWVAGLSPEQQSLIVAHERAHLAARDPVLVLVAQLMRALLPWNPLVWWQSYRLRAAIELDCDARVLANRTAHHDYAELLLSVGHYASVKHASLTALAEPRSLLEARIRRILEPRLQVRWRGLRTGAWAALAILMLAATLSAPVPRAHAATQLVRSAERALIAVDTVPGEAVRAAQPQARGTTDTMRRESRRAAVRSESAGSASGDRIAVLPATTKPGLPGNVGARTRGDTVRPELRNPGQVREATRLYYPPLLRDAGIGGTVHVLLDITEQGEIANPRVQSPSGYPALDEAALRVARVMRFIPAQVDGRAIPFSLETTIVFSMGGQAQPPAAPTDQPTFTPYTVPPELANREELGRELIRLYPSELRNAGIGGSATVWFFIDESGQVLKAVLKKSSGYPALDEAALQVARVMRFTPARNRDQQVKVWVDLPIVFKAQ